MAGGWPTAPLYGPGQDLGGIAASSRGTLLTTGAANTKGAYAQLIASTANDISRIVVMVSVYGMASFSCAVDIAVAASGSEASGILIQNLVCQSTQMVAQIDMPCIIKAGSRIAARAAAGTASDNVQVQIVGFDSGYTETLSGDAYDTYGYSGAGAISGVSVDPGGTVNTKGAYAVLTSSSTNDIAGFFLGFDYANFVPTVGSDGHLLVDLAIGAAASERIIIPNIAVAKNNFAGGIQMGPSFSPIFYLPIKAVSRIAVRAQSASNTTSERLLGVSLYGMRG